MTKAIVKSTKELDKLDPFDFVEPLELDHIIIFRITSLYHQRKVLR